MPSAPLIFYDRFFRFFEEPLNVMRVNFRINKCGV